MAPDDPLMTPNPDPAATSHEDRPTTAGPEPTMTPPEDRPPTAGPDPTMTPPEDPITAVREPPTTPEEPTLARRPDLTSLVAGIALMALGALLVLASEDVLELSLGYLWPALFAAAGAVLLASGVRRRRER